MSLRKKEKKKKNLNPGELFIQTSRVAYFNSRVACTAGQLLKMQPRLRACPELATDWLPRLVAKYYNHCAGTQRLTWAPKSLPLIPET